MSEYKFNKINVKKHEQTLGTLHVEQQWRDEVEIYLFLVASVSVTVHVPLPKYQTLLATFDVH